MRRSQIPKKMTSLSAHVRGRLRERRELNPHRTFRRTPPHHLQNGLLLAVRGSWQLIGETLRFIWGKKRLFFGFAILFAVVSYLLIGGISQIDYSTFKDAAVRAVSGDLGALGTGLTVFGAALGGALNGPTTALQDFLTGVLTILFWLAVVWAARNLSAGQPVKLRDALYNSASPFMPMLVILGVVCLQLIPATLGIFSFAVASNGQWLQGGVEAMTFAAAAALLSLLSLYWLTGSLLSLIIVTLPGMYPWRAMREASKLVTNRRWSIVVRIIGMALFLLIAWSVIFVPTIMLDNWLRFAWLPLVPAVYQLLIAFTVIFSSVYTYKLYRSLL